MKNLVAVILAALITLPAVLTAGDEVSFVVGDWSGDVRLVSSDGTSEEIFHAADAAFTSVREAQPGVFVATDIVRSRLFFIDGRDSAVEQAGLTEPWDTLLRGDWLLYGVRSSPGFREAVYCEEGDALCLPRREYRGQSAQGPRACLSLQARADGAVYCLDTDLSGVRPGRLWLIPGDIRGGLDLSRARVVHESYELASMAVDPDGNGVYLALMEGQGLGARIVHLDVELRTGEYRESFVAEGGQFHFSRNMPNAFSVHDGALYVGVNARDADGDIGTGIIKVNLQRQVHHMIVSPETIGTSNPISFSIFVLNRKG